MNKKDNLAFSCSKCGGDYHVELQPDGSEYSFLCRRCKYENFPKLIKKVEEQHKAEEETMMKAETMIMAQNVARGMGILAAAQRLQERYPFFVDERRLLWIWNSKTSSWHLSPDTPSRPIGLITVMRQALELIGDATVRYEHLLGKAIQQVGLTKRPEALDVHWIQLGKEIHNIRTGEVRKSSPEWFVPGAIPWTPNEKNSMPTIERLFEEWVGEKTSVMLFEILAYCLYRDYPLHIIVALFGSGRNGKGTFFRVLRRFVGDQNIASTEIDRLLSNRFETFHIFGKLTALVGETDDVVLTKTSLLKSLSGQDSIPFEQKGGAQFTAPNTAKIILSTNNLPPSTDTSDGWARRWLIVDFPNEFPEGKDVLETIPNDEYRALARRALKILPELLERGHFYNQGTIEERRQRYIERSEPFRQFLEANYEDANPDDFISYSELYAGYCKWLSEQHKRTPSRKAFSKLMAIAGYSPYKTSVKIGIEWRSGLWIFGLRKKSSCSSCSSIPNSQSEIYQYEQNENSSMTSMNSIEPQKSSLSTFFKTAEAGHTYSLEEIAEICSTSNEEAERMLKEASKRGDIFESRPNQWGVLK